MLLALADKIAAPDRLLPASLPDEVPRALTPQQAQFRSEKLDQRAPSEVTVRKQLVDQCSRCETTALERALPMRSRS